MIFEDINIKNINHVKIIDSWIKGIEIYLNINQLCIIFECTQNNQNAYWFLA